MTPMTPMTASELDTVYTGLCRTMTRLGESNAPLFLARFALLAIDRIGDAQVAQQLIAAAAEGMAGDAAASLARSGR